MTTALRWTCARLEDLPPRTVYQLLALRSEVFVVEQACVFLDPDGLDLRDGVLQLLGHEGDRLSVYARLVAPGVKGAQPMIGRVITAPAARGRGLGRVLMQQGLAECAARWPGQPVAIGAQAHLAAFYGSLGFLPTSPEYDEDGIPHIDMRHPGP